LWNTDIIKHWNRHHKNIKVLFLTRPAEQIAQSQKRQAQMNTPAYRCFPDLIEKHEQEFEANLVALGIPYAKLNAFVHTAELLQTVHEWTGVKHSVVQRKWDGIFDKNKISDKSSELCDNCGEVYKQMILDSCCSKCLC